MLLLDYNDFDFTTNKFPTGKCVEECPQQNYICYGKSGGIFQNLSLCINYDINYDSNNLDSCVELNMSNCVTYELSDKNSPLSCIVCKDGYYLDQTQNLCVQQKKCEGLDIENSNLETGQWCKCDTGLLSI